MSFSGGGGGGALPPPIGSPIFNFKTPLPGLAPLPGGDARIAAPAGVSTAPRQAPPGLAGPSESAGANPGTVANAETNRIAGFGGAAPAQQLTSPKGGKTTLGE